MFVDVPTKSLPELSMRANSLLGPLTRSGVVLAAALIVNVESGPVSPIPTRDDESTVIATFVPSPLN